MKYGRLPAEKGQSLNPGVFVTLLNRVTLGSGMAGNASTARIAASAVAPANPKLHASFLLLAILGDVVAAADTDPLTEPETSWRRSRFRSTSRSLAVWYLSSRAFSSALPMIRSSSGGTSGFSLAGGFGVSRRMPSKMTAAVSPRNGALPVTIWYKTAPKENKSER